MAYALLALKNSSFFLVRPPIAAWILAALRSLDHSLALACTLETSLVNAGSSTGSTSGCIGGAERVLLEADPVSEVLPGASCPGAEDLATRYPVIPIAYHLVRGLWTDESFKLIRDTAAIALRTAIDKLRVPSGTKRCVMGSTIWSTCVSVASGPRQSLTSRRTAQPGFSNKLWEWLKDVSDLRREPMRHKCVVVVSTLGAALITYHASSFPSFHTNTWG